MQNTYSHGHSDSLRSHLDRLLKEDGVFLNDYYAYHLPQDHVDCTLKFKSDLVVAGLPYFFEVFQYLGRDKLPLCWTQFAEWEGKKVTLASQSSLSFKLPFGVVLTGERLALNLLQRTSAIATYTHQFAQKAQKTKTAILDTRKTTPGLRFLEKYAVRVGGGHNHRQSQTDMWMVKDNHKKYFGGLSQAVEYFRSMQSFYTPMVVEIHSKEEFHEAVHLKIRHVMLDNFKPELVKDILKSKPDFMTIEISGGVRLENLDSYLMEGIDAISVGGLTNNPPPVDISLKFQKS